MSLIKPTLPPLLGPTFSATVEAGGLPWQRQQAGAPPAIFDPSTLTGLTVDLRGDAYSASPWSNGGSASDFSEATNPPSTGRTIGGRACVDFDGTNDKLTSGALSTIVTASEWWLCAVVEFDDLVETQSTNPWTNPGLIYDAGSFWGLHFSTSGIQVYQWDGAKKVTTAIALSTGTPYYIEASYNGTSISCRVGSGSAQTAVAGSISTLTGAVGIGDAPSGEPLNGGVGDFIVTTSIPSAGELTSVRARMATRWGVTTP